jgi:diketogulonate reductase-like aldo/keto reductase
MPGIYPPSRRVTLDGSPVPRLGLGTWRMGENPQRRDAEVAALRLGLDLGLRLIDTAEMYANAETVVGNAIQGRRNGVFVVTKVLPENASRRGTVEAAERSLQALRTDVIDLYLLHWKSRHPLEETFEAFHHLRDEGKIRTYGVSNFDVHDMEQMWRTRHGEGVVANQVLYSLAHREPEWKLVEQCRARDVEIMAYTPLEPDRILEDSTLGRIAKRHDGSPAAVALAWLLRKDGVLPIPKASTLEHVRENAEALEIELAPADLESLDQAFPPPRGPASLGSR